MGSEINYSNLPGNAKSEQPQVVKPEATKVVTGDVKVQKKKLGAKFREVFLGADIKQVSRYVITDVIIPATRDMIFDMFMKGVGRTVYGERGGRPGAGFGMPQKNYAQPVNRGFQGIQSVPFAQKAFPPPQESMSSDGYLLQNREDAEAIIDQMNDYIRMYQAVTLYDLKQMLGFTPEPVDNTWGWTNLRGGQIKQNSQGWVMELPNPIHL